MPRKPATADATETREKRRPGRPRVEGGRTRKLYRMLRVTPEELARMDAMARAAGAKDWQSWALARLLS